MLEHSLSLSGLGCTKMLPVWGSLFTLLSLPVPLGRPNTQHCEARKMQPINWNFCCRDSSALAATVARVSGPSPAIHSFPCGNGRSLQIHFSHCPPPQRQNLTLVEENKPVQENMYDIFLCMSLRQIMAELLVGGGRSVAQKPNIHSFPDLVISR